MSDVQRTGGDYAIAGIRAALGTIPIVGSAATELFGLVVTPPLERRRTEWMQDISRRLADLEARGVDVRSLSENPAFIDITISATRSALLTSKKEKLDFLKNAVVNCAAGFQLEEVEQQLFFAALDRYSVLHVELIALFDNPQEWFRQIGQPLPQYGSGSISHILEQGIPFFRGRRELYTALWRQLVADGFMVDFDLFVGMTGRSLMDRRTTELGEKFAAFVRSEES